MSIRFSCPSCDKSLVTPDRFVGRQVRCPGCDINLTVPKPQTVEPDVSVELVEEVTDIGSDVSSGLVSASMVEAIAAPIETVSAKNPTPAPPKRKPRSIKGDDHGGGEEDLEWDITPMVDVAFLLLIFFMLTASFSIQKVIRTKPQNDKGGATSQQNTPEDVVEKLVIQVDEFSAFTVISPHGETQDASSRQELVVLLKDLRPMFEQQEPKVIIQAHEDSTHGAVVACMDAAREAEFSKFQVAVVESFD